MKILSCNCITALMLGIAALTAQVQAQEFRIGFVNTDRIFKEATSAKAAQTKLEQEFSKREKELVDLGASLKNFNDKLEREGPTLSDSQRATRQKQLVDQDRDFQRKRREFQEDLNQRRNEELAGVLQEDLNARKNEELQMVLERANRVVKQVAEAEKYDLVIQEAVYISPKHDITDKVIKALNAGAK